MTQLGMMELDIAGAGNGVALEITSLKSQERDLEQSWEQLRRLTARLHSLHEEEQSRIARDIHEVVGQSLTALKLDLAWVEKRMGLRKSEVNSRLHAMKDLIDDTIQTVRRITTELRPGLLDDMGIVEAIEWQTRHFSNQTKITCNFFSCQEHIELDHRRATALFRIFQEVLTNIAHHAEATKVWVNIYKVVGHVMLEVKDNGKGIRDSDLEKASATGLLSVRERALAVDGDVHIFGIPAKGTTTVVRMPTNGKDDGYF